MGETVDLGAGTLGALAEVAEGIRATPSKLAKVATLAAYLRTLPADRLALATRYFAGQIFATGDPRVLNIGGAALWSVLGELSGADGPALSEIWSRHRDAGDSAHELRLGAARPVPAGSLDLLQLHSELAGIAESSGVSGRRQALAGLLGRCSAPEVRQVVRLITGDTRIGLREGLVEEAIGAAFGRPASAVSRAALLVGDLGEAALLAAQDRLGEARPRLFSPLRFMLASPVADAGEAERRLGAEVWVEDKYDGIRCQLHRGADRVALYSRDLREVTEQFPEVTAAALQLPPDAILDGEILAGGDGEVMSFGSLQRRLGRRNPPASLLAEVPVIHVAWDLLVVEGESLLEKSLGERRRRLEALGLGGALAMAHREVARGAAEIELRFQEARRRGNEGLLLKDPRSPYTPGRRGLWWLKLKRPLDTLDVVVVAAEWGHGRRRSVLSDLTFAVRQPQSGGLAVVGKAYTGLNDAEIAEMTELLRELTAEERGGRLLVRPTIVLEVAFDSVQRSTRHDSGYALRFPRIVRWRRDRSPSDIDDLERVASLAAALARPRRQLVDRNPA